MSCLDDDPETLAERVAARLGHDPRPRLLGEKAVRVTRNLRPGADPLSVAKIVGRRWRAMRRWSPARWRRRRRSAR